MKVTNSRLPLNCLRQSNDLICNTIIDYLTPSNTQKQKHYFEGQKKNFNLEDRNNHLTEGQKQFFYLSQALYEAIEKIVGKGVGNFISESDETYSQIDFQRVQKNCLEFALLDIASIMTLAMLYPAEYLIYPFRAEHPYDLLNKCIDIIAASFKLKTTPIIFENIEIKSGEKKIASKAVHFSRSYPSQNPYSIFHKEGTNKVDNASSNVDVETKQSALTPNNPTQDPLILSVRFNVEALNKQLKLILATQRHDSGKNELDGLFEILEEIHKTAEEIKHQASHNINSYQ